MRSDETAAAYLHRLHRRIVRARFGRSGRSPLVRAAKRAVAPFYWHVQPIVQSIAEVRSRSRAIHAAYGIGTLRQLAGCIAFTASFRVSPDSYFDYRLFDGDAWQRRSDYLYHDELWSLLAWLNAALAPEAAADLSDKRRFHDRASRAGLPIIPILAEFDSGSVLRRRSPIDHPRSDLFSKFADRWYGEGARVWQRRADGTYAGGRGVALTLAELYDFLRDLSFEHPVILQPRLANHPELSAIAGKGLSTVRVVTLRDASGRIEAALACFRMAVGSLVADNFAGGGLASPVRLEDGRLGPAVFKSRPGSFASHPDTGALILGRSLPNWPAVTQLAIDGHRAFEPLPSIGWDIAITENGPVIVEGNSEWGVNVVQMAHRQPLAATAVPARLVKHFERLLARG